MSTLVDQLNGALSDAMESVRDALVQVQVPGRGGGAGIVWRDDGLIVTNAHVVGRGPAEVVLRDGRLLEARLVARSRRLDLAVLSVDAPGLDAAPIGDSMALRAGELVFALGHPFGVAGAVTSGVVIGLEPDGPDARRRPDGEREWLVVHMRLRPGNSGGPVLDARGRVVGISTIMAGPDMGMAVPSHVVAAFLGERVEQPQARALRI
ncbi:MAG: trypsin-like peptidase domain-containing protein [Chloroflexi bacterium]|nr:trypsin-like peptidase domain-containing protein [Chloroflexota bacterium]MCI0778591.1 trypsin-like peptidase domain-containing protein [Chloroflexota bacterium]MCI0888302.1 trypsin-like peptidase domain-containing protein [Chloroflexota bacterium]